MEVNPNQFKTLVFKNSLLKSGLNPLKMTLNKGVLFWLEC
jgi:hypothetical protein